MLLDQLSAPAGSLTSINSLPLSSGTSIVDLIGVVVGNLVTHEAGHILGNFHTASSFAAPNPMDTGLLVVRKLAGLGDDGVFGTGDDVDVDLGPDALGDVVQGIEDTLNSVAFGASTPAADTVVIDGCDSGAPNLFPDGLSPISDAVGDCAAGARNHGRFVSCVGRLTRSLRRAGWVAADYAGLLEIAGREDDARRFTEQLALRPEI